MPGYTDREEIDRLRRDTPENRNIPTPDESLTILLELAERSHLPVVVRSISGDMVFATEAFNRLFLCDYHMDNHCICAGNLSVLCEEERKAELTEITRQVVSGEDNDIQLENVRLYARQVDEYRHCNIRITRRLDLIIIQLEDITHLVRNVEDAFNQRRLIDSLLSSRSIEELAQNLLDEVIEIFKPDLASFGYVSQNGIRPLAAYPEQTEKRKEMLASVTSSLVEGISKRFAHNDVLHIPDLRMADWATQELRASESRSYLGAVLRNRKGKVEAIINITYHEPNRITPEQIQTLQSLLPLFNIAYVIISYLKELLILQRLRKGIRNARHDIMTPVSGIKAGIYLLRQIAMRDGYELPEEQLNRIERQADRIAEIIESTRDYEEESRPNEERVSNVTSAMFREINLELVKEFEVSYQGGEQISFIPDDELYSLNIDPLKYARSIINLFSNAVKYQGKERTPTGRSLLLVEMKVSFDAAKQQVSIEVADSGIGIAEHELDLIFQPLQRGEDADAHAGGSGIGLSSVKDAVESMDGTVSVVSKLGEGSKFTITLPASPIPKNIEA